MKIKRHFVNSVFFSTKHAKFFFLFVFFVLFLFPPFGGIKGSCQNIGINTTGAAPNASAILDVSSTQHGLLIPRMTAAERDALKSPTAGLLIYNTDSKAFNLYTNTGWFELNVSQVSTTTGATSPGNGIAINATGAAPASVAILDVSATDKGLLLPRTTTGSITSPATGLLIYNTATNRLSYYNGTSWITPCQQFVSATTGSGSATGPGVAINATGAVPDASAILDISSANKGFRIPVMTDAQRDALNPMEGLLLYSTSPDPDRIDYWNGTGWQRLETVVPAQPSTITGVSPVCQLDQGVAYSVTNIAGVTYTWTYSGAGFNITSGQGTNAITVNFSNTASSGTLTCTPSNGCGNGTAQTFAITVNGLTLSNPGTQVICMGENATFSTTFSAGYTYQWQESTDGGSTWSNLSNNATYSGVTTATLTITCAWMDNYRYRCVVTEISSGCSKTTSNSSTLNILSSCTLGCAYGTTWVVPCNWNNSNNTIEVWGAGGNGADGVAGTRGGGGGGGGAYAKITNVTLTPGSTISIQAGCTGGDPSYVKNNSGTKVVEAVGGANASGSTGGAGGAAASCIGSTKYSGGNGGNNVSTGGGGGGGGAAGSTGAGKNGGSTQAGSGGGGGGGGDGGASTVGANSITSSGGNGGNANDGTAGGAGSSTGSGSNAPINTSGGGGGGAGQVTVTCVGGNHSSPGGGAGGGGTRTNTGTPSSTKGGGTTAGNAGGSGGGGGGYSTNSGGTGGEGKKGLIRITFVP